MTTLLESRRRLDWLVSRTLLLLEDPNGEKYSSSKVIEALNFACLEIAISTEMIKDEVAIQLQEDGWYYDVKERVNEDSTKRPFGYAVRIGISGDDIPALLPVTTHTLDWTSVTLSDAGEPTHWRLDFLSYGQIGVGPIPQSDGETLPSETDNLQVLYVAMPNPMETTETDYPDALIPSYYHEFIPFFAAKYLLDEGDSEDMVMGDRYMSKFEQGKRGMVSDTYYQTNYADVKPM